LALLGRPLLFQSASDKMRILDVADARRHGEIHTSSLGETVLDNRRLIVARKRGFHFGAFRFDIRLDASRAKLHIRPLYLVLMLNLIQPAALAILARLAIGR